MSNLGQSIDLESGLSKEVVEKESIMLEGLPISPLLDMKWISELARESAKKAISQHFLYFANPKYFNHNLQEVQYTGKNDKQCKICIANKTIRQRFKYPPDSMEDAIEFNVISILKRENDASIAKEVADESAQHTVHSWLKFNNVRETKE